MMSGNRFGLLSGDLRKLPPTPTRRLHPKKSTLANKVMGGWRTGPTTTTWPQGAPPAVLALTMFFLMRIQVEC